MKLSDILIILTGVLLIVTNANDYLHPAAKAHRMNVSEAQVKRTALFTTAVELIIVLAALFLL